MGTETNERRIALQSWSMSTTNKLIAVAQLCSTSSKTDNLRNIAKCARYANDKGCAMLFLPECCGFMGESGAQSLLESEPVDKFENDPKLTAMLIHEVSGQKLTSESTSYRPTGKISIVDALQAIAKESSLWISAGGIHISTGIAENSSKQRVYNTHMIFDNYGVMKATYRKIHLFDVSIPGKVELRESNTTAPGTELVVCDSPVRRLGLSTCYDVRFPETYIALVQKGAEILLVPSAFTVPTGTAHWHVLLQARSIESQCYVVAAAQYSRQNTKRESYGHSLAVDPWGKVVADAGGVDGPGTATVSTTSSSSMIDDGPITPSIVTCEIDREKIASIRERMPLQLHRRNADF